MGKYVANEVVKLMIHKDIAVKNSRILILGFTFKENCPDVRNTKVIDIINELNTFNIDITVYDPWANPCDVVNEYKIKTLNNTKDIYNKQFDAIILAVGHNEFKDLNIASYLKTNSVIYDVKRFLPKNLIDQMVTMRILNNLLITQILNL